MGDPVPGALRPFPLILIAQDVAVDRAGIPRELVGYVNALVSGGVEFGRILPPLRDLYALDFYHAQVCNGGHAQFVLNSDRFFNANVEHAIRAAAMIDLPDLEYLLKACRNWVHTQPGIYADLMRNGQSLVRPAALDALDKQFLVSRDYAPVGIRNFVARQPERVRAWIGQFAEDDRWVRDRYLLHVEAWVLQYPGTRLLDRPAGNAAIADVIAALAPPSRRPDRALRRQIARWRLRRLYRASGAVASGAPTLDEPQSGEGD